MSSTEMITADKARTYSGSALHAPHTHVGPRANREPPIALHGHLFRQFHGTAMLPCNRHLPILTSMETMTAAGASRTRERLHLQITSRWNPNLMVVRAALSLAGAPTYGVSTVPNLRARQHIPCWNG
jgi:hypothetical protein